MFVNTYKTIECTTVIINMTREIYRKNIEDLLGVYYKIEIHINTWKVIIKRRAI